MLTINVVQMAMIQVIDMVLMANGGVATAWTMNMRTCTNRFISAGHWGSFPFSLLRACAIAVTIMFPRSNIADYDYTHSIADYDNTHGTPRVPLIHGEAAVLHLSAEPWSVEEQAAGCLRLGVAKLRRLLRTANWRRLCPSLAHLFRACCGPVLARTCTCCGAELPHRVPVR